MDGDSLKTDYSGSGDWAMSNAGYQHKVSDPENGGNTDGVGDFLTGRPGTHDQWTAGQTRTADAYFTGGTNASETHTARPTLSQDRGVITMAQWTAAGKPIGHFWVVDTDDWAYWANPLMPGEATSLLLDGIRLILLPD